MLTNDAAGSKQEVRNVSSMILNNPSIPLFRHNVITFETTLKQLTSAKSGHFN